MRLPAGCSSMPTHLAATYHCFRPGHPGVQITLQVRHYFAERVNNKPWRLYTYGLTILLVAATIVWLAVLPSFYQGRHANTSPRRP